MSKDYLPDFRLVKLVCQPSPLNMGWSRIAEQIKKGSRLWEPDFTGGASLIRTGDLRIMIPNVQLWIRIDVSI